MKRPILIILVGAVIGACAGWPYWNYMSCASGSCAITSSPLKSTLYGTLMGGLLFNSVAPKAKGPTTNDGSTTNNN